MSDAQASGDVRSGARSKFLFWGVSPQFRSTVTVFMVLGLHVFRLCWCIFLELMMAVCVCVPSHVGSFYVAYLPSGVYCICCLDGLNETIIRLGTLLGYRI